MIQYIAIIVSFALTISCVGAMWAYGAYVQTKAIYEALWEELKTKNIDKEN